MTQKSEFFENNLLNGFARELIIGLLTEKSQCGLSNQESLIRNIAANEASGYKTSDFFILNLLRIFFCQRSSEVGESFSEKSHFVCIGCLKNC